MEFTSDPFVFHAVMLILAPVLILMLTLLWRNAWEVRQLAANFTPPTRAAFSVRCPCKQQPTYIDQFLSSSSQASSQSSGRRSPLLVADDESTYSCFGDSLVARPWLLTSEDSAALDNALNFC